MLINQEIEDRLTKRTRHIVGRKEEIEHLKKCLYDRGERHFIYYWAHGGLGKTRLLEELRDIVNEAIEESGPKFHCTGIIDLYHTDTHSTSDVERAIVESLDPEGHYFAEYRRERRQYVLLRERGTDPRILEQRRERLSQLFVEGCHEMALDAHKLVICFDTVELLQHESSVIEERAQLDAVETRIKPWLLDKLSQLKNVLVVFAGRPKQAAPGEPGDPQTRLVEDFERAFGDDLKVVKLAPLTLDETRKFIAALTEEEEEEVIPEEHIPVVHSLVGGRPIFIHLIVDLILTLSPEPRTILNMFDQYADLVEEESDEERLREARRKIEKEILENLYNNTGEFGGYLTRIALMPKGVDVDILQQSLGLPRERAEQLLAALAPLSFVKQYAPAPGAKRLHGSRTFLHDEMYQLLTSDVVANLRINERQVAHALEANYYAPQIVPVKAEIMEKRPSERVDIREELQKLEVERLYYLLAWDACKGYGTYRQLSEEANRRREVGYSMRLLDEFLRFYNTKERRIQFEEACIPHERVLRESTEMWSERFFWWGQHEQLIRFTRQVLDDPEAFSIDPNEHTAILANICARWASARAAIHGYETNTVEEAQAILDRLPPLAECSDEEALARARLATAIGYHLRMGGLLSEAANHYVNAKAAFLKLATHKDELAMLLNNLAYVYAMQGRTGIARPLAHDALRITEELENRYSIGLTLSTLASIALIRGNHSQAISYAQEALDTFRLLEDARGIVLAYRVLAQALRRSAKHELEKGRRLKLEDAQAQIREAFRYLEDAVQQAKDAELEVETRMLYAELGRVSREMGHVLREMEDDKGAMTSYRAAERHFRKALEWDGWSKADKADTLQDLAETLFFSQDEEGAREILNQIEELIGPDYRIDPATEETPDKSLPREEFSSLGKVEMTRGQIAFQKAKMIQEQAGFQREELLEGLRRYTLAYAYFLHFSPDAVERDKMIQYLYNHLREAPIDEQRRVLEAASEWAEQPYQGVNVSSLMQRLKDLLGV